MITGQQLPEAIRKAYVGQTVYYTEKDMVLATIVQAIPNPWSVELNNNKTVSLTVLFDSPKKAYKWLRYSLTIDLEETARKMSKIFQKIEYVDSKLSTIDN